MTQGSAVADKPHVTHCITIHVQKSPIFSYLSRI